LLINEAAVKAMGLKNPIGTQFGKGTNKHTVIGVTSNIVMESPFKAVDPMLVYFDPRNSNSINIRLKSSVKPQQALKAIETVFIKYNPAVPFDYKFVDEEFGKKFLTEGPDQQDHQHICRTRHFHLLYRARRPCIVYY
jgi:hypothetical protein